MLQFIVLHCYTGCKADAVDFDMESLFSFSVNVWVLFQWQVSMGFQAVTIGWSGDLVLRNLRMRGEWELSRCKRKLSILAAHFFPSVFHLPYHDIAISRRIFFICIMFCVFQFPTKPLLSLICVFLQARFACLSLCFASSSWCRLCIPACSGFHSHPGAFFAFLWYKFCLGLFILAFVFLVWIFQFLHILALLLWFVDNSIGVFFSTVILVFSVKFIIKGCFECLRVIFFVDEFFPLGFLSCLFNLSTGALTWPG